MSRDSLSTDSLAEASRGRARFSGHGNAKGAAGFRSQGDGKAGEFLSGTGETAIVNPQAHGFETIRIGMAWDNLVPRKKAGFLSRLVGKEKRPSGVDLDLGCLYEMANGKRGCVQAFGDRYGAFDELPYIALSGDERTGDAKGDDEFLLINGQKWPEIKRLLIYVYIYDGAPDWAIIKPQIHVNVTGEPPMIVIPNAHDSSLAICAIGGLENVRNGIKIQNFTEYFPGHSEMDRAFGFGLEWSDGQKR